MMKSAILTLLFLLPGASVPKPATHWVASWASSQMAPEPQNNQAPEDPAHFTDATLRQVIHLSLGGSAIRLRLSNAWGTRPLTIDSVHVAAPVSRNSSAIQPGTDIPVTFAGLPSVTIPSAAEFLSDPIALKLPALADLTVTFHLANSATPQTSHPGSRATSYMLHGNHAADLDLPGAEKVDHWFQLAAVDVAAPPAGRAIVAFGDSITDGHGSTTNANDRWPDLLAARLQSSPATRTLAVVNQGIGGNHLLTDGLGINALARLDRDVLAQSSIGDIILLEGINDLGMLARGKDATPEEHAALVARMIAACQQIVLRAHAHGVKVIGATLTPWVGSDYYRPTPANEADRQAFNTFIRSPGNFDAVIDFDLAVRDPADPAHMLPSADSGDHLHPGPTGYRRMADAIPLTIF